jgi:hypothetical protein
MITGFFAGVMMCLLVKNISAFGCQERRLKFQGEVKIFGPGT